MLSKQLLQSVPRPVCDAPLLGSYCKSAELPFWTNMACTLRVKIDENGNAAIVHSPKDIEPDAISRMVLNETKTFFRVDWNGNITSVISNCTAVPACRLAIDGACVCDIVVRNEQAFFDDNIPRRENVLNTLSIGAFDRHQSAQLSLPAQSMASTDILSMELWHRSRFLKSSTTLVFVSFGRMLNRQWTSLASPSLFAILSIVFTYQMEQYTSPMMRRMLLLITTSSTIPTQLHFLHSVLLNGLVSQIARRLLFRELPRKNLDTGLLLID